MSRQFKKDATVTVVATAPITKHRFVSYNGQHTPGTSDAPAKDCQGIAEESAVKDEAVAVVTGYSYLLEVSEAVTFGAYIKPAADGTGRGAVGTLTDHCGRALSAATGAGQLIECQIVKHVHT